MTAFTARVGAALGDAYRIERELGGGGMSRVYVAEEIALGRRVVVKVLPPDMGAGLNAERFRREIQLAASLQHPHVVPLLAAGRHEDIVWYTMPLIEGESLRARLAREGELPVTEAVRILRDVADALTYAHAQGVVHRDIKPDNVLFSGRHAVVTDFGVAKALSSATGESSLTSIGVALGTPSYMAPEQAAADPHVDHRADIYALGAMAYEMLTGQPPFSGTPQAVLAAHVTQTPDPVTTRRASVPPALAALVMRCLQKKAADRYQTATELHQQLEAMTTPSGGMAPTSATAAASGVSAPTSGTIRALITPARAAGLALVAGAIALAVWAPWRSNDGDLPLDSGVVAVLPFRVAGAHADLQYLREGMMDLLHAKLTGAGGLRAADVQSVTAAVRSHAGADGDVAEEALLSVVRRVGAGQVIQGSLVGQPDRFVLNASLIQMPRARVLAQTSVTGSKDSIFTMVDQLAQRLLALGAGAAESQLDALTTTSLEALRAYLDGQVAYRRGAFPEATAMLERAVGLDSTFGLALSALIESSAWYSRPSVDMGRVRRLAWQYRDRLHPTDRQILQIRLGSRWPAATPWTERINGRAALTRSLPESPLAWYYLADAYFHYGALSGYPDYATRSARAFENAVRRDSTAAAPLEHLARLADLDGNIEAYRRWGKLRLALDSTSRSSIQLRIGLAQTDPTSPDKRWADAMLADSVSLELAMALAAQFATTPYIIARADSLIPRALARDGGGPDALQGRLIQSLAFEGRGRLIAARALADSVFRELPGMTADQRATRAFQLAVSLPLDSSTVTTAARGRTAAYIPGTAEALWLLRHGDLDAAAQIAESTRARLRTATGPETAGRAEAGAQLKILAAALAQAQGAPNAKQLLVMADTGTHGIIVDATWALLLSEMLERDGQLDAALNALDHAPLPLAAPGPTRIADRLRAEGRLAAQLGQRERAIRAYRTYLLWRTEPDPELIPERDLVRAELARLEGSR